MTLIKKNKNYRLLFSAAAISNLGDGISLLAFPWLATLITRDTTLIALVAAMTRLPWLVLSLPAGVITDRFDRRQLMVQADGIRLLLTTGVVGLVLSTPTLPLPDQSEDVLSLIGMLCIAAFLLGSAEVIRDNAAQSAMPSIVDKSELEQANGQLWSIELMMGQFVGPPLAGVLIALAVPVPFVVNGIAFGISAWFMWRVNFEPRSVRQVPGGFWLQMCEGFDWIRNHRLILQLAVMLGCLNFATMMSATMLVLLSQEVFELTAYGHGLLLTAGAAGGVMGGMAGPRIARWLGSQRTVVLTLLFFPVSHLILALTYNPFVAGIALFVDLFSGMTWNVVTVSLRQRLIPDNLLGRVNSIYRFLGWGTIPLGAVFAGCMVSSLEGVMLRAEALRSPYWFGCLVTLLLAIYGTLQLRLPSESP